MSCLHEAERLTDLIDERLTAEEAGAVQAHLADCSTCAAEMALLQRGRVALSNLPGEKAPEGLLAGVHQRLQSAPAQLPLATPRAARGGMRSALAAGLLTAIVCGGTFILLNGTGQSQSNRSVGTPVASKQPTPPDNAARLPRPSANTDEELAFRTLERSEKEKARFGNESQNRLRKRGFYKENKSAEAKKRSDRGGDLLEKKRSAWAGEAADKLKQSDGQRRSKAKAGPDGAGSDKTQLKNKSRALEEDAEQLAALRSQQKQEHRKGLTHRLGSPSGKKNQHNGKDSKADSARLGMGGGAGSKSGARQPGSPAPKKASSPQSSRKKSKKSPPQPPRQGGLAETRRAGTTTGSAGSKGGGSSKDLRDREGRFSRKYAQRQVSQRRQILVSTQQPEVMSALLRRAVNRLGLQKKLVLQRLNVQKRQKTLTLEGLTAKELGAMQAEVKRLQLVQRQQGKLDGMLAALQKSEKGSSLAAGRARNATGGKMAAGSSTQQDQPKRETSKQPKRGKSTTADEKKPAKSLSGRRLARDDDALDSAKAEGKAKPKAKAKPKPKDKGKRKPAAENGRGRKPSSTKRQSVVPVYQLRIVIETAKQKK